ncbi:MAG: hypothetical protein JWM86_2934, partial [Thermoleophilia bacterium]|nr:hypothetical protein [Thermoleophilia bacterium]
MRWTATGGPENGSAAAGAAAARGDAVATGDAAAGDGAVECPACVSCVTLAVFAVFADFAVSTTGAAVLVSAVRSVLEARGVDVDA